LSPEHLNDCSCRDKGFDSRWTVSEAPKKKDGWEEVLIKGAKGKKKANTSEKRGEATDFPQSLRGQTAKF